MILGPKAKDVFSTLPSVHDLRFVYTGVSTAVSGRYITMHLQGTVYRGVCSGFLRRFVKAWLGRLPVGS